MFLALTAKLTGRSILVNVDKIIQISADGDRGTLIEFGIGEYIAVEEEYKTIALRISKNKMVL